MRTTRWLAPLALAAVLSFPAQSQAQIPAIGVYGAYADGLGGVFDGVTGAGARVTLGFPVLPVDFVVGAEYYFPDCGQLLGEDLVCALAGVEGDVNYAPLPLPFLTPYVSGGMVLRAVKAPDLDPSYETETGFTLGLGATFGFPVIPFSFFAEGRKEWVGEGDMTVFRVGMSLGG